MTKTTKATKTFAIVDSGSRISSIGTREEMDELGWGHDRELVELVRAHSVGDVIEYNERGVEVA